MNSDGELLERLVNILNGRDLFGETFLTDDFDDWHLAKELGEFLVRIEPESSITGHALLARAHRHLGNRDLAVVELRECQGRAEIRGLEPWEVEMIQPLMLKEATLLSIREGG